uniref:Reverse transcriptase domain-containing protein n=1 Tax=Tanacetum cinerariifolium TaxID=118510 RepID=A0A699HNC4_TANCI|nr:reverse transcriptase domain-containing protein [Tanacetum cinerariifolium]
MFERLIGEITGFTQHPNEALVDAWLRMKDLLHSCHRDGLGRGAIIQIFYHGLDEATQAILNARGIFLYKTPNKAHRLLEDRVLLKLDWSKDIRSKLLLKTVAFGKSSDNSQLMEKIEALTIKIDSQFNDIKGEIKEMREGCNSYGGPHPLSECDDKPMEGPKGEEANYAYGGYRGNYYAVRHMIHQLTQMPNHHHYDDSEDEADEAKKEEESSSSKQTKFDSPPLKAYKLKIPYPQPLCKERTKERYAKFIDLIKEVKINVLLVDILADMPNYGKLLKDLVSNKSDPESFLIPCTFANSVEYLALADLGANINLMPYSLDDRITFLINKAMKHSHSNDDTCFRMDVIDEVTEEELDALLDDSEPFLNTPGKINETSLYKEFKEFMAVDVKETPEQEEEVEDNFEELPLEGKTSIQDPPTDLEMKPLPKYPEYAYLEKDSFLPVVISALLKDNEKKHLVTKDTAYRRLDFTRKRVCLIPNMAYPANCMPYPAGQTIKDPALNVIEERFATKQVPVSQAEPFPFLSLELGLAQDMLETFMEVFMDGFLVFGDSFDSRLANLEQMLIRFKQAHRVLNWEKCHFMVTEGIVIDHKVSSAGLEVDKAKINILLVQEFDIEMKNKKGAENVTADHLSRLENPNLEELRDEDVDDNFPDEPS